MNWSGLGMELLGAMLPVIAAILSALASWAIALLAKKYKLQINLQQDAVLRIAIRNCIAGAEEWAARKLKAEPTTTGLDKSKWVKDALRAQFPKMLPEQLDLFIDEELAQMKGVGATGDKAVGQ